MSLWDDYKHDYKHDYFNSYRDEEGDDEEEGDYHSRHTKACDKCGHSPLVWNEVRAGVFRLYDQQLGKLHVCPPSLDFK